MSYRGHQTVEELRAERDRCTYKIRQREFQMTRLRRQRDRIDRDLMEMGKANHNLQQVVASCNLWIARKELDG